MALLRYFVSSFLFISCVLCLPVQKPKEVEPTKKNETTTENLETVLEYERYLKEVVEALESDPEFRKKLDKAPEADIRNGKIAQELDYVGHHVRSKLDEIKRKELERLRSLAMRQFELSNDIDRRHLRVPEHVDHRNEHTFEIDDLRKLILQASKDLAEADKQRREEFKQYEMQKEFEKQSVLNELDEENRKKYEEELRKQKEKHDKHEKVHHPGNRAQLEEVWENQDHMEGVDFDPKAFFMMHDVDGNGFWDENELKALFVKELEKVYNSGAPEDDIREKAEEMERMREHVFSESDTNRDGLISFDEFLAQTKRQEFQQDPEWETVDKVPQFTHEEYLEFERKRQEEINRLIAAGQLPPHPNMPQGYYPKDNNMNPQHYPQGPSHPQQVPQQPNLNQQYHQQVPQQPNQNQQYHQQVPQTNQNQQYHQQVPQQPNQNQQYQQVPQKNLNQPYHQVQAQPNQQQQVPQPVQLNQNQQYVVQNTQQQHPSQNNQNPH